MSEFDRSPLTPDQLKPARYFAASYAGEHVAGTEFVIGALFVSWGVGAIEVIQGLLIGNLLAVLTWAIICAPVATSTRLTLYAYLEKITGPGFMKIYSLVNGTLFCVLAGAMITVSASAVRILFGIPPQIEWYPTSTAFVFIAIAVGAVVTFAATRGFAVVARFAEVSAPWLVCAFFVGAIAMMPSILSSAGVESLTDAGGFVAVAQSQIWIDQQTEMNIWHVAAIAWGANLAFHGALGDMTILRFAKKTSYGWFSAIGMFIGHFGAWLAAGVMGAAAATLLKTDLTALDAGEVAYQALGAVGILAVILAGWTTSNPTIYRAGLAFQSLNPKWSRERVTLVVGIATTTIACFPFVFTGLLNFLGLMALVMAPTGGIIIGEHYLLNRLGMARYWREARGDAINLAAVGAWIVSLLVSGALFSFAQVHVLFLFVPAWICGLIFYLIFAAICGARSASKMPDEDFSAATSRLKSEEKEFLERDDHTSGANGGLAWRLGAITVCGTSLVACFALALDAYLSGSTVNYFRWLPLATAVYFVSALSLVFADRHALEQGA